MRQDSLGRTLTTLMTGSANVRVRVEAQETGDTNAPDWELVTRNLEMMISDLSSEERLAETAAYEARVTHEAFCVDSAYLKLGYRLVETFRKRETSLDLWWTADEPRTWEIVGKRRLAGLPEPNDQVRLDLALISAVT